MNLKKPFNWIFSNHSEKEVDLTPAEKLNYNMRITAKNRYNASKRLNWQMKISFFTTTILSLGLIFIPLTQISNLKLNFDNSVLNLMQIFLAVAVLVYSVINGMAKYESRIQSLRECGDYIRDLTREFRTEKDIQVDKLKDYSNRYNLIVTKPENHETIDYLLTKLELREDFKITGLRRLFLHIKFVVVYLIPFLIPICLLSFELIFISDMLGSTEVFTELFITEKKELLWLTPCKINCCL